MLIGLQYLRGVAALMIVYFHAVGPVERLTGTALPVSISGSGVDLFFVLSGCVMWLSTHDRAVGPGQFLLNRLVRVAPLYWILTLVVAGLAFAAPALLRSTAFDPAHLVASLLFLPWPNPRYPGLFPVIIPGWTLNYEMFFYAVFALMLPFRPAWRVAGTLAVLGGLVLVGQAVQPGPGVAAFYTDAIVLEFGLGVLVGALFTARIAVPRAAALAAFVIGLGLLVALDGALPKFLAASLPAALVVGGLALYERGAAVPRFAPARHLGDASYALYLSHPLALGVLAAVLAKLGPAASPHWLPVLAVLMVGSMVAGSLIYRLVERPATEGARRLVRPRARPAPPAVAPAR
ncbi:acyltransferase family protein [Methylobacterium dankookense]|uniref:Acyltransferase 3 domain-containing protein n=1 Tax=Methylobacterium dankookense TaxID=560405 RepID=A0A564G1P1_9HYPH|nr:acyltransferase [Methylobacterium dankookense]GJD56157.1 hypothetical protein IFDJLNFL_2052 [Methylobacterium dankookense]VUF13946.1 hypothetical protein MTDSW087_03656 [Methylobacterium dankookense]